MKSACKQFLAVAVLSLSISGVCFASPCDGVDRSLTDRQRTAWTPAIKKQLATTLLPDVARVDVLQSFRYNRWRIVYVDSHASDEIFLFYSGDPLTSRYVTWWAGAAQISEERETRDAILKNAPSIPLKLANCFAWHVTNDRDK